MVDVTDINLIINEILTGVSTHDLNGDGAVDVGEMNLVINSILNPDPVTPPPTTTYTVNGVSFTMVNIAGGTFTMGATAELGSDNAYDNEKPPHEVTLSDYAIGQTEVTQELWVAVMGSNPSFFRSANGYVDNLQRPVEFVSWKTCQMFLEKLNGLTGQTFRLPTEAEWEYAARGGEESGDFMYSGSNDIDEVAWYYYNSSEVNGTHLNSSDPDYGTHSVATKAPNELGLYDMTGNVLEWCSDWYGPYSSDAVTDPTGPESGKYRVCRGGSWSGYSIYCRVLYRDRKDIGYLTNFVGLRLAL